MTKPTRQEIIDAHNALEGLENVALNAADLCGDTDKFLTWKNEILKVLPLIPRPTMADIEWDDEKHFLAEADHPTWGKVIMLFKKAETGNIFVNFHKDGEQHFIYFTPENLTPTGRRYILQEGE